jgi:hypothetical protein
MFTLIHCPQYEWQPCCYRLLSIQKICLKAPSWRCQPSARVTNGFDGGTTEQRHGKYACRPDNSYLYGGTVKAVRSTYVICTSN